MAADGETVLGVGQVSDEYEYREELAFPHIIKVNWIYVSKTKLPKPSEGLRTTVYQYKEFENIVEIEKLVNIEFAELPDNNAILPLAPLTGIASQIENILERKKQIIIYGPPGTGKTYHADITCRELAARNNFGKSVDMLSQDETEQIQGKDGFVRTCCFHPSYGYEDFIEGIKPSLIQNQTVFKLEDGIFKKLCKDAENRSDKYFYLIIDEINRGDVSRIFGELMMIIEAGKRGKSLILPLSKEAFSIPPNVHIVGTMNTADRSIALLDVALRRRFGFKELMPDYSLLDTVFEGLPLDEWLKELNMRICEHIGKDARNLQIGHSYFLEKERAVTTIEKFKRIIKEDILPLIEEYCYGDYALMGKILGTGLIDVKKQAIRYEICSSSDLTELINALLSPTPQLRSATADELPNEEITEGDTDEA